MSLTTLDYDDPLWKWVTQKLRHDVYHLPEYCRLEADRKRTSCHAFLIADDDKIFFVPYLLRSCSDIFPDTESTTFDIVSPYGYPGILLSEKAEASVEFINSSINEIREEMIKKNIISAFFRLHPILNHQFNVAGKFFNIIKQGESVSIDLSLSEEKLWSTTRKGHQSSINKCKRLGVTINFYPLKNHVTEFLDVYGETMDRVKADDSYRFDEVYVNGLASLGNHVLLGVASINNQLASVCIFFECCGIVQAHLCGTKSKFLSYSPLMLILDHARHWYKQRGNEYLHLGAGYKGKTEDPIYKFKAGFSKQRFDFSALCIIGDENRYRNLVETRAQTLDVQGVDLLNTGFFPSYRSPA